MNGRGVLWSLPSLLSRGGVAARPGWFRRAVGFVSDPRDGALRGRAAGTLPRSSATGDTTQTSTGRGPP